MKPKAKKNSLEHSNTWYKTNSLGGEVFDVITFPKKRLTFFYESTEKVLYRIDPDEKVSAMMSTENNDIPNQVLRRDKFENNLFFFYKEDKFAVLQDVSENGYSNMLQFGGFSAKSVADFRAIGKDKFMILTKNGNLSFFEFSSKHIKKILDLDLNYTSTSDLEFVTFCICPRDKYMVVSVADKVSFEKKHLFLLEISGGDKLNLLDRKNFDDQEHNSVFYRLGIHYTSDDIPVVICFEKGDQLRMVAFAVDDDQLNQIESITGYHSAPFLTIEEFKGEIKTMDVEGYLYTLPLVDVSKGAQSGEVEELVVGGVTGLGVGAGEGVKQKEMREAVADFERSNPSIQFDSEEVDIVVDREKEQLANNYNNRRSMTIDFNCRKIKKGE